MGSSGITATLCGLISGSGRGGRVGRRAPWQGNGGSRGRGYSITSLGLVVEWSAGATGHFYCSCAASRPFFHSTNKVHPRGARRGRLLGSGRLGCLPQPPLRGTGGSFRLPALPG